MKKIARYFLLSCCLIGTVSVIGCNGTFKNARSESRYSFPELEPQWIRDGKPLMFENVAWYPQDDIDVFLDEEVYPLGEYEGVQIFINKADVRPYDRLYTKFAENKFRVYKKKRHD